MDKPRVVLVGAGFIGFIVLNAMYKRGWDLTVVEREQQVLPRMLDAECAGLAEKWLNSQGIDVHCGTDVQEIRDANGAAEVVLGDGQALSADIVIMATGIRPNIELAEAIGAQIDHGVVVNDQMQTSVPGVYAAGDIAQGPSLYGATTEVHAIQPTAVDHGRVAGANMAGHEVHYPGSLLMNVVDVCGLQTASYGAWNDDSAKTTTISNDDGFVYRKYLWHDDQLVGAIFAGRPNDMGMLTDVGMVKGIMQTKTPLGAWRDYLEENPFDIRRAYVANGVAQKLVKTTLLGKPTQGRDYQFGGAKPAAAVGTSHAVYVGSKQS